MPQSQIQLKRAQFHTEIRKVQLDQYRKRKRQELFGFGSNKNSNQALAQAHIKKLFTEQFKSKVIQSPYPFNKPLKQFFLIEFGKQLDVNKYNLESMNEVLSRLIQFDLDKLADFESFSENFLQTLFKIFAKMMVKISQIPYNSILRSKDSHLIQQIYKKIFYSVKTLIRGMVLEQDYQKRELLNRQKRKKLLANNYNNKQRQIDCQKLKQNLIKLESMQKNLKNPLQVCNSEIIEILHQFCEIYVHYKQMSLQNQSNLCQNLTFQHLDYLITLWYMTSNLNSSLFVGDMLRIYLQHMIKINLLTVEIIDMLVETLSNFLLCQTFPNSKNKLQQGKVEFQYSNILITLSLNLFQRILNQYDISITSTIAIIKALSHQLMCRKLEFIEIIFNTDLIRLLIQILYKQMSAVHYLNEKYQNKTISEQNFIEAVNDVSLWSNEKYQIYQFFGALFSMIDSPLYLKYARSFIQNLRKLIFYEFKKLIEANSNQTKTGIHFAIEQEEISSRESVCISTLFLSTNILAINTETVQIMIEGGIISILLDLWNYFYNLGERIKNQTSSLYNKEKLSEVRTAKYSIIHCVYNIVSLLTKGDEDQNQKTASINKNGNQNHSLDRMNQKLQENDCRIGECIEILVQLKDCAVIQLLIHYLKTTISEDRFRIQSYTVKYALSALEKLMMFVTVKSLGNLLIQKLLSSHFINLYTFREVITQIFMSEDTSDGLITKKASTCLDILDSITSEAGFNWDYGTFDSTYNQTELNSNQFTAGQIFQKKSLLQNNVNQTHQEQQKAFLNKNQSDFNKHLKQISNRDLEI